MMWNGWGHGGWAMGLGIILMLLFWALVVVGLVVLVRLWVVQSGQAQRDSAPPRITTDDTGERPDLAILRERYARGEISHAEFEQMKRDLEA